MKLEKKEEAIYVALAFLTSIGQLTWVQMCYNDPSFAAAWTAHQWLIVAAISFVFVMTQTLIAWKAFLHNPSSPPELPPIPPLHLKAPDGTVPPPPIPVIQKPADATPPMPQPADKIP